MGKFENPELPRAGEIMIMNIKLAKVGTYIFIVRIYLP